jgi:hypothetical protein
MVNICTQLGVYTNDIHAVYPFVIQAVNNRFNDQMVLNNVKIAITFIQLQILLPIHLKIFNWIKYSYDQMILHLVRVSYLSIWPKFPTKQELRNVGGTCNSYCEWSKTTSVSKWDWTLSHYWCLWDSFIFYRVFVSKVCAFFTIVVLNI